MVKNGVEIVSLFRETRWVSRSSVLECSEKGNRGHWNNQIKQINKQTKELQMNNYRPKRQAEKYSLLAKEADVC